MQTSQDNTRQPYIIGLTGGIGSGKTLASNVFKDLGIDIIDADDIAKSLVQSGCPALKALEEHFGKGILKPNGQLNRAGLRDIVFNNEEARQWLEDLLHPLIRKDIHQQISLSSSPYLILSAPLLLESKHYDFVKRILVIDTTEALQLERSSQRDNTSSAQIKKIISAQMQREDRLSQADDVIVNNQDIAYLEQEVAKLHKRYLDLSITQ